jgi:hypothetical protein
VATLPVSRKRGCPLGSRNKKTLVALVSATAAVPTEAAPAAAAISAEAATAATAAAAGSVEAAATVTAAAASIGAAPAAITAEAIRDPSGATASAVRKSRRPPGKQRLSYTFENGYTTFLGHLRAGCKVRLPLPFRFVDTMGGNLLTHAIVEECSSGQPLYPVEMYHDGMGKSYLRNGWSKFVEDYDLYMGWSLIFTRRAESHFFCICVVDTSNCARAYSAWA